MLMFNKNEEPTKEFFVFLKYNSIPSAEIKLSESDELLYKDFSSKMKLLSKYSKNNDDRLKVISSSLFSMFGYSRHYCSMTGSPIIGKYFKINGKIVSREAYESYRIIQEIEKNEKFNTPS